MQEQARQAVRLEVDSVHKDYQLKGGTVTALRDINLTIEPGEFVSIVGASGCGKTTLLRIMNGLVAATSGRVIVNERVITKPTRAMSFVFQQDGLLPWRNVLKNTILGPELARESRAAAIERAHECLELVGLAGFERQYPHQLSGGMRQRVNLARALVTAPSVLLMDEPFAALDAQTREVMQLELLRIWRQTGQTVVFVTHQIEEALYLSDRVIVLTARPGSVKRAIEVPFARPRDPSVKRDPRFGELTYEIWKMIEEEVRFAVGVGK